MSYPANGPALAGIDGKADVASRRHHELPMLAATAKEAAP